MRKEKCPNESNEPTRTNCHHRHLYLRHHADKISALPDFLLQKAHAENDLISRQGVALRGVRPFGGILLKARLRFLRLSRNSGVHRNRSYRCPAPLEKANAALHCRRHGRLHVVTSTCILAYAAKSVGVSSPPRFDLRVESANINAENPQVSGMADLRVLF